MVDSSVTVLSSSSMVSPCSPNLQESCHKYLNRSKVSCEQHGKLDPGSKMVITDVGILNCSHCESHLPEELVAWNSLHSIISFMILCDRHLPQLITPAGEFQQGSKGGPMERTKHRMNEISDL
ncbi:DUF246 domain-containing protein [Musa troglodytarum]|uniref:DUF246 domain-containing protein n=1 Tax=Musa troglodytarum TaxID=320322 RepID=A0A9E7HJN3_9LILI|nr:DUF246 domain-containing protein [Musa troglodytarum]URE31299.1 DUF246 domain-containing protein [Musa troglodytarum]